ncbi:MAG: winged helix-turn-helix domain-containing protein [Alphaproteobacteria bacterium]|nr:winged helix-turn-helix domain-containing protein [Alphaproteobacteria bacterium]
MATWRLGDARVDLVRCEVTWPDRRVALSTQEADVLRFLAGRAGDPATREELLEHVWGYAATARTRAVDHAVRRLRTKLEADPENPEWLLSVRGVGYRLALPGVVSVLEPGAPVGRTALLRELTALARTLPLVTLIGPGGIGKTTLARAWAATTNAPVVALERSATSRIDQVLSDALEVPVAPASPPALVVDRVARALLGRHVPGVVLDGAEERIDEVREVVVRLNGLGIRTVVTSQVPLESPGETLLIVEPLAPEAAREVLGRCAPPLEREVEDALVAAAGGHPLTLVLAGSQLAWLDPGTVLDWLSGGPEAVHTAVSRGVRALPGDLAASLYVLSLAHGIAASDVAAATGSTLQTTVEDLGRLRARGLMDVGPTVPEIVRRAVLAEPRPALERALAESWSRAGRSDAPAAELASRIEAIDPDLAAQLWVSASRPMLLRGPVQLEWADRAVSCTGAPGAHLVRGALRHLVGRLAEARQDLDVAIAHGGPAVALEARVRSGWLALYEGDVERAESTLREARQDARRSGASSLEAMAEVRLASLVHRRGDARAAIRHLQRALGLQQALGEAVSAARSRSNLAMMHAELGEHEQAREHLEEALADDRAAGVEAAVPQHLLNLGGLLVDQERWAEALGPLEEARSRAAGFGDLETEGLALLSLGMCALMQADPDAALVRLTRGRTLLQTAGNQLPTGIAWAYCAIANAALGDVPEAQEAREEAAGLLPDSLPALQVLLVVVDSAIDGSPAPAELSPLSFVRLAQRALGRLTAR